MSSIGSAPLPREPYAGLPELPEFTLTSTDVQDGGTAPEWMRSALFGVAGGQDRCRRCGQRRAGREVFTHSHALAPHLRELGRAVLLFRSLY